MTSGFSQATIAFRTLVGRVPCSTPRDSEVCTVSRGGVLSLSPALSCGLYGLPALTTSTVSMTILSSPTCWPL